MIVSGKSILTNFTAMYGQDQRYDFTSNSDTRPGLRAINLQFAKLLMALTSDAAQQDQRSQQVLKVLSCWQRASLNHSFLDPLRTYLQFSSAEFPFSRTDCN